MTRVATLLAALLLVSIHADALPFKRSPRMVTLPLKRLPPQADLHPQLLLQQHINRGQKRHARMTGSSVPSDTELAKRMVILPDEPGLQAPAFKRFNTNGVPTIKPSTTTPSSTGELSLQDDDADINNGTNPGINDGEFEAAANGFTDPVKPTGKNSLGLSIIGLDVGYFATFKIGTPKRDFRLLVDSGSADLWVGGEQCKSKNGGDCGNHVFLGDTTSSSFVSENKQWDITYGSGSASGVKVQDTLDTAGLTLKAHQFGIANLLSESFTGSQQDKDGNDVRFDGLMGLALTPLSNQKVPTPVEAMAKAKLIDEAITSYKMARSADKVNDGEITFGGLDETKFDKSSLVTVDNTVNTFWVAKMGAITVDGTDLNLDGRTALLDTGTTLMLLPPADAVKVHAAIDGAKSTGNGRFTVPCTTTAKVALTFGGKAFEIDPRDLVFVPSPGDDGKGDCASGIASLEDPNTKQWLVGDTFLKSVYFSTNASKNKISLAKLA